MTLAEELHFGRAAARLHMTQPPLTQQIRMLESDIGTGLFRRTTRHVELTDAGRLLYPEAQRVLSALGDLERVMSEYVEGARGVLRVGFVDSAAYAVVPRFINLHRATWPLVDFTLESMSSDQQAAALARGEIDIGICRTTGLRTDTTQIEILREPLLLAVPAAHPAAARRQVSLADLAGEVFVGFDREVSPTLHSELQVLLASRSVAYHPSIEATEYSTILGLVASGQGVALVPSSVATHRPPGLEYVSITDSEASLPLILMARLHDDRALVARCFQLAEDCAHLLAADTTI